ncbi:hypothetical protein SCUCBS95973_004765 [Sporothrix curviconia]|uniref:Phosphotransferase n=1 Tax=Sporothrix curviconia TaxID=1260050 RepID=A0ABP0BS12_9PEZI
MSLPDLSPGPIPGPPPCSSPVDDIVKAFTFSDDDVRITAAHLLQQLKTGLVHDNLPFQHPSFVTAIPNGSETGRFLSVDLGGTNCRICLVDLRGDGTFSIEQQKHAVPQHVRVNERYEPLFDWVASQIGAFLDAAIPGQHSRDSHALHGHATLALGFTFSFTCTQTSLAAGTLLHWDKGWDIPSALGRDPCALLQAAVDAQQLPVRVAALANDSVGSLLTWAYTSASATARTLACVIVGTGTNAAYVEQLHNVKRICAAGVTTTASRNAVTAMNTEWGCMDDEMRVLPQTRFDDMVDARSTDCGSQMLEKRVSGLLAVDDSDDCAMAAKTKLVADTLGAENVSAADVLVVQRIANAIVTRAARLVGAATAAIVLQSSLLSAAAAVPLEKEQPHVATEAVRDVTSAPAAPASSFSNVLRKIRGALLSPIAQCLDTRRPKIKTDLSTPSPSSTLSPSSSTSSSPIPPAPLDSPIIDIGVTGSVIEHHPTFEKEMRAALRQVPGIGSDGDARIRTGLCQDGSAVGAALMVHAAMAQNTASE